MIHVYKIRLADRRNYKLEWTEPGTNRRRSRSARTADAGEAERLRGELEYELNHGLHHDTSRLAWEDFSARYLDEKLVYRAHRTRVKWREVAAAFLRLTAPRTLGAIDAGMLSRYTA